MSEAAQRGLPLIAASDALRGDAPAFLERYARQLSENTPQHFGWLSYLTAIAPRGFRAALPPSIRAELESSINELRLYINGRSSIQAIKKSRSQAFHVASAAEKKAVSSVLAAQKQLASQPETLLDQHALRVVERYAALAAYHAVAAVCHSLDAVHKPQIGLKVLAEVGASRAYQAAGLGAARHYAFRLRALEQAEWELSRHQQKFTTEQLIPLAGQIFHEYLGTRWKTHQEVEALQLSEFASWALAPGLRRK